MAEFPSPVSRQPPDEVEAQDIAEGVCAQINPLISLPDDVLFKILLNLCAEDIWRASLVCRSLYFRTIRSDKFVNLDLQQNEYGLFFQFYTTRNGQNSSRRPIFVSMKQGRVTVSDYNNYTYKFRYILKNSCNGLFPEYKFSEPSSDVHLSNPVTGRALRLPPLPKNAMGTHCCVGYSEASKSYKVALAYSDDGGRNTHMQWAVLTVGLDRSWRNLATEHLRETPLICFPLVTEGFLHWTTCGNIVRTMNVETEVMTVMWAPMSEHPYMKWYLSTGKTLSVVVRVEDGVFRVWEMVCGDSYYWREWEPQIVLGSEIRYSSSIYPVGWLQQMEVLVFKGWSKNRALDVFYVVIATGEIGWIAPVSSSEEKGLVGEFYTSILPHKNTLVQLEGYY